MDKREFMIFLRRKLRRFGDESAEDAVAYYEEIINEKIRESGMSQREAVASLGDPNKLAAATASEMVANNKVKNPSRGIFLIMGTLALSPVLFPLALAVLFVYFFIFAFWIAFSIGFGAAAIGSVGMGIASLFYVSNAGAGLVSLGVSLIVAAVFALLCVVWAKYGLMFINLITVKLVRKIRSKSNKEVK